MADSGRIWSNLAEIGRLWLIFAESGLANSGRIWLFFQRFLTVSAWKRSIAAVAFKANAPFTFVSMASQFGRTPAVWLAAEIGCDHVKTSVSEVERNECVPARAHSFRDPPAQQKPII